MSVAQRLVSASLMCASLAVLQGCAQAPKQLYNWGNYQAIVYDGFKGDGKSPQEQIDGMNAQLEKIKASNTIAPPGFHAHLGYLLIKVGRDADGVSHLEQEKVLFPESAKFVEMLLSKSKGSKS